MAAVGSLEDEARKRKERLKALKKKQGNNEESTEPEAKRFAEEDAETIKPVFKNYKPVDDDLSEHKVSEPGLPSVEDQIADQLSAGKPAPVVQEVDIMNLAPRKPDWDLKRDVAKKLERLEKRTQRAIAELIRERIQSGQEDLSTVATIATTQQNDSDSD